MRGRYWNVAAWNMPSSLFRVLVPSVSQLTAYTQFDGCGYHGDTLISVHDITFSHHPKTRYSNHCTVAFKVYSTVYTQINSTINLSVEISLKSLDFFWRYCLLFRDSRGKVNNWNQNQERNNRCILIYICTFPLQRTGRWQCRPSSISDWGNESRKPSYLKNILNWNQKNINGNGLQKCLLGLSVLTSDSFWTFTIWSDDVPFPVKHCIWCWWPYYWGQDIHQELYLVT